MNTIIFQRKTLALFLFSGLCLLMSCSGSDSEGENNLSLTITSPVSQSGDELIISPGEVLDFQATVTGGEPSYRYDWTFVAQLDSGTNFSGGLGKEEDLGPYRFDYAGRYIFYLTVNDSGGGTREATVIILVQQE